MAGMIFRIETFFKGTDNFDQLFKIVKVLGEKDLYAYCKRYNLVIPKEAKKLINGYDKSLDKVPWKSFVNDKNRHLASDDAIELLDQML